ncbi:FimV/HubP family polar landmark protein [Vibrio navarrensis]|uniref:FimV/HubP family polar landmark protein n=1 Tax=Vibrio navarrensis TaxID=29495 RepID=UPI00338DF356
MRQIFQRLLAPLLLMTALPTSVSQADGIRLVGPTGEVQSSPSFSEQVERANAPLPSSNQPSTFYGPTAENETLWSVASRLRPANNVSVQQTLLAIYRLNPQAFENQNIHSLIPGSNLRIPSLEQVRSATTEQAVTIMKAHQDKLRAPVAVQPAPVRPTVAPPSIPVTPASPEAIQPQTPVVTQTESPQVKTLEKQLESSESELTALEEKNHNLRLMLAQVQSEVDGLKSELGDENRIRSEVEKLLAEEREKLAEQQKKQPSALDNFLSNGWLVAAAALIPGALIGLLIVMLLGRRKESAPEPEVESKQAPLTPPPVATDELDELSDELDLDDDLFSETEGDADKLFDDATDNEDDVFGNLDDDELDFNLEGEDGEDPFASIGDDGDLDTDFDEFEPSANGISVKGSDKALGLQEMERALDDALPDLEITDDEESDSFDLSDDNLAMSEDDFAELLAADEPSEELGDAALDQSMLDDLFASMDEEDDSDEFDLDLEPVAEDEVPSATKLPEDAFAAGMASDEDVENLFAQFEEKKETASADDVFDELEALSGLGESDDDDASTALLDEMLEEDNSSFDALDELEQLAGLDETQTSFEPDGTELLDEMLDLAEESEEDEFDPLSELDELASFGEVDPVPELDEDSIDLLDELLDAELDEASDTSLLDDEAQSSSPEQSVEDSDEAIFDELIGLDETQPDNDLMSESDESEFDFAQELEAALDASDEVVELSADKQEAVEEERQQALTQESQQEPQIIPEADLSDERLEQISPDETNTDDIASLDKEFNSQDFIDDLADVAPLMDPLLDVLPDEVSFDEVTDGDEQAWESDEVDESPSRDETPHSDQHEPEQDLADEFEQEALFDQLSPEPEQERLTEDDKWQEGPESDDDDDWLQAAIDEVEQPGVASEEPVEESRAVETSDELTEEAASQQESELLDDELDEDWLQAAIDDVEQPESVAEADEEPAFDAQPIDEEAQDAQIDEELSADTDEELTQADENVPVDNTLDEALQAEPSSDESDPEQIPSDSKVQEEQPAADEAPQFTPTPNTVANEFGTPQEEDWADAESELASFGQIEPEMPRQQEESLAAFADEDAFDNEENAALQDEEALAPASHDDEVLDDADLPEFDEEDARTASENEAEQESEASLGTDAIGLNELELNEFGEAEDPESELIEEQALELDDLELPEFGEEDALAAMAEEPEVQSDVIEDQALELDDLELPEFGEEDALAAMAEEPEAQSDLIEDQALELGDLDLPEFGEEDALAAMAEEPEAESELIEDQALELDDLDLPEFGEEDALAAMAEETEAQSELIEDEALELDDLDLPEFGEEDALAAMAEEPEAQSDLIEDQALELDDLDLPEFGEEDALAAMAEEPEAESDVIEDQTLELDDLDLPEFGEEDALAAMAEEPEAESDIIEDQALELDDLDLPEFGEEEALELDDLDLPELDEEDVLAQIETEPSLDTENLPSEDAEEIELPQFGEEEALEAVADQPSFELDDLPEPEDDDFVIDDLDLPEFGEEDAISSVASELGEELEPSEQDEQDFPFNDLELPSFASEGDMPLGQSAHGSASSYEEQDALYDVFAQEADFNLAEDEVLQQQFDEAAMANLLSEEPFEDDFFAGELDGDTVASAGMDLEAMLAVGEDWDGFKLPEEPTLGATEEMPEDEREIWGSEEALQQPTIDDENWAEQDDFDPKRHQFMTIDELMAQVDGDEVELDDPDLKLDVGLDEFPDVIGDISDIDVDENAEAAGKLDLAKIYIEMNDESGAVKLLEEAIVYGDDAVRREAKQLIDKINGR